MPSFIHSFIHSHVTKLQPSSHTILLCTSFCCSKTSTLRREPQTKGAGPATAKPLASYLVSRFNRVEQPTLLIGRFPDLATGKPHCHAQ